MLREVARVLADDLGKRVIIVDTSNEIAGDGDIPHPGIGDARRMQVRTPTEQHAVMIEAVENHMPEVIVIDEIGTELEAGAARTIAERGVQLVGTAHGNTLDNLMLNPTLSDLVGGIQSVTLGDEEARRRGTQKTVLERKAPPTFDVLVEIVERDNVIVHRNVAETVDAILRGHMVPPEARCRTDGGELRRRRSTTTGSARPPAGNPAFAPLEPTGGFGDFSRGVAQPRRADPGCGLWRRRRACDHSRGAAGDGRSRGLRAMPGERIAGRRARPGRRRPASSVGGRSGPAAPPRGGPARLARSSTSGSTRRSAARWARAGRSIGLRPGASADEPFGFGVSRKRLEQAVRELGRAGHRGPRPRGADAVVTLRNYYRRKPGRTARRGVVAGSRSTC